MKSIGNLVRVLILSDGLPPADLHNDSCAALSYAGTFAGTSVYLPTIDCVSETASVLDLREEDIQHIIPPDTRELVWVQESALEDVLRNEMMAVAGFSGNPWDDMDTNLLMMFNAVERKYGVEERVPVHVSADDQVPLGGEDEDEDGKPHMPLGARLLHRTHESSLIAFIGFSSDIIGMDAILSPMHKATVISYPPTAVVPVPTDDITRVRTLLSNLKFDKTISRLVNNISVPQMTEDITWLTGEAKDSPIESRHSFHPDTLKAAEWIAEQIEGTGADCALRPFLDGFAPNVICRYPSTENTTALVLLSAHYDSRGSFGQTRAPGGDDDGSGTTSILSIARTIERTGVTFKSNVELCLFAGEEQGLLGSRAYARELREANANITLMIQADMLAYHVPGEPPQLGLPDLIGTPEVAQLVANISALYSPELEVGFTPACCSDHQSFHTQGFAATQVFERAGPIADPMYHNSGDLSKREGYDLEQVKSIAKVQFGTLLHAAGFDLPK